jgi:DNA-directed RNA polymerase specialized sigma24 family protein
MSWQEAHAAWLDADHELDTAGERDRDEERPVRRPVGRRNLTGRFKGIFTRRGAQRLAVDEVLRRAELLPPVPRAIVLAHYDAGVSLRELAMLHHTTPLKMWRRLIHWRDTLSDPAFLLAAKFRDTLPHELELVAAARWEQGLPLRALAAKLGLTLHAVRKQITRARSLLLLAASRQGAAAEAVGKLL